MKERPILMSAPMVRSTLDGTKTQTRRIVKPQPPAEYVDPEIFDREFERHGGDFLERVCAEWPHVHGVGHSFLRATCPYGRPNDRLWVRETHFINDFRGKDVPLEERKGCEIFYRATDEEWLRNAEDTEGLYWKPSIHMPRWASRILLEVTVIRVERLQDISEADAIAEGVTICDRHTMGYCAGEYLPPAIRAYRELWEQINGPRSWDANPWVWALSFNCVKTPTTGKT